MCADSSLLLPLTLLSVLPGMCADSPLLLPLTLLSVLPGMSADSSLLLPVTDECAAWHVCGFISTTTSATTTTRCAVGEEPPITILSHWYPYCVLSTSMDYGHQSIVFGEIPNPPDHEPQCGRVRVRVRVRPS